MGEDVCDGVPVVQGIEFDALFWAEAQLVASHDAEFEDHLAQLRVFSYALAESDDLREVGENDLAEEYWTGGTLKGFRDEA